MVETIGNYIIRPAKKKEGCEHKAAVLYYKNSAGQQLFVKDFANIENARMTAENWARSRPRILKYEWRDDEIPSRN